MGSTVSNFGKNVTWTPRSLFQPGSEEEVVELLDQCRGRQIRVGGSLHAWNGGAASNDVFIDLKKLAHVEIYETDAGFAVKVGAGCQIKRLLKVLDREGLTLPSVGLIAEQTIAGATATGTHGSGRHSLSHYIQSARIATYTEDGSAIVREVSSGSELRAVRCSIGCMGVIVEITLPCVPQYYVRERLIRVNTLEDVLESEQGFPIQQFYLIPHSWRLVVHERGIVQDNARRGFAVLYRAYWLLAMDFGMHALIKMSASLFRSRRLIHFFFRNVAILSTSHEWQTTDRSYKQLTMKHDLFRHVELEIFVRRKDLSDAVEFVTEIVGFADGAIERLSDRYSKRLSAGLRDRLAELAGTYVHHYPICVRLVKQDDTLLSMSSGGEGDWYAISFITYVEPRDAFYSFAAIMAEASFHLFSARSHWGKWFPLGLDVVEKQYPQLDEFREICRRFDPSGAFVNQWVADKIGLAPVGEEAV